MTKSRTVLLILFILLIGTSRQVLADVFASNIRITQPNLPGPFDGRFTDGSGAFIRFNLSDHADSVVILIKLGTTPVRTLKATNLAIGDTSVAWDGRDANGNLVTNGDYTFTIACYDKGYSTYTEISYPDAGLLSMRGMTTVNNPALRNFGFIFDVDNGGFQSTTGVSRFTSDGKPWGNSKGIAKLDNTGIALGPGEARWASQADRDGYVYVLGRTAKQVYRYHTDSMNVVLVDSSYGSYYPYGIAIREDAGGAKTVAVVANVNSATATITGDSRILRFKLGAASSTNLPAGTKDTLVKGNGSFMFWDAAFGRDSVLYATFMYPGDAGRSGIAKFDLAGKTLPVTMADTSWTMRVDSGRVGTCSMYFGAPADGSSDRLYFVNARIANGNPPSGQGIYVLTGLNNARPTMALAFADKQNNASITRSDISVDAVGNIVYFENSNEEIEVIAPPTGANSYTTTSLTTIRVFGSIPIKVAVGDANKDFQPDSLGKTVTVSGIVNSVNLQGTANYQYTIQDDSAGIMIFKSGAGGTALNVGDRVLVTGVIAQFRGTTEITPANFADVTVLDTKNQLTPIPLTLPQYLANGELYESRLIKISGVGKKPTSVAWPAAGADANMTFWNGWDSLLVRLDKDTQVPGTTEPVYPVNVQGVATQFTSASNVYNDGYQVTPIFATDFTANVAVPPNPHFTMIAPKNSTVKLDSAAQTVTFNWNRPIDLNVGEKLIFQWLPVGFAAVSTTNGGVDTFLVRTGSQLGVYLGTKDTLVLKWSALVKDVANPSVYSLDTVSVTLVRGTLTGVSNEGSSIPTDFALEQNFPNPFNPSTTVRVALPTASTISIKIYSILGQEIATLYEGTKSAGFVDLVWHGKDSYGRPVASGVYLYRIDARAGDGSKAFVQSRKMMMLK